MNKEKKILLVSLFIFLILVIVSLTYAFFAWRGTNTTLTTYAECFDILYAKGTDIGSDQEEEILMPSSDYTGGLSATVKMGIDEGCNLISAKGRLYLNTFDTTTSSLFDNGELKYVVLKNGVETGLAGSITSAGSIELNIGALSHYDDVDNADSYTVYVWIDEEFVTNDDIGAMYYGEISAEALQYEYDYEFEGTAAQYITSLYTNAPKVTAINNDITYNVSPLVDLMNDRLGGTTNSLDGGDLRYYGKNPHNYLWLGETYASDYTVEWSGTYRTYSGYDNVEDCLSSNGYEEGSDDALMYCGPDTIIPAGSKKLYRIIGVFNNKLKVIANDSIGHYSWNTSDDSVNDGAGVNEWSQADLMKLLNPGYTNDSINNSLYWNSSSGDCYFDYNNDTTECSFTSNGLSSNVRNMISESTWYLGGFEDADIYANEMYDYERDDNVYEPGTCGESWCNDSVPRTTTWLGKVALMSPSDYAYATDFKKCNTTVAWYGDDEYLECYSNDWLSNSSVDWLLTPYSTDPVNAWVLDKGRWFWTDNPAARYAIRPVFYLNSNLPITEGTGTEQDPYILGE